MKKKETIRSLWTPTAGMLTGARRAAMLLLTTLLLTMTAQTAWAQEGGEPLPKPDDNGNVTLEEHDYVVNGDVTINGNITANNPVNLTISNGAKLSVGGMTGAPVNLTILENGELSIGSSSTEPIRIQSIDVQGGTISGQQSDINVNTLNMVGGTVKVHSLGFSGTIQNATIEVYSISIMPGNTTTTISVSKIVSELLYANDVTFSSSDITVSSKIFLSGAVVFDASSPAVNINVGQYDVDGGTLTISNGSLTDGTNIYTGTIANPSVLNGKTLTYYNASSEITVSLNAQGGSGGTESVTPTSGEAMPAITPPTRTGYTFGGYYTEQNGGGTQYYNAEGSSAHVCDLTGTVVLYAKWTANTYTVTFDRQGGSGGTESVNNATFGSAMPAITPPTRTDCQFVGYYTGVNGGGTKYYNADGTSARTWGIDANTTLYAYWKKSLSNSDITIEIPAQPYNGSELTPDVIVKDNGSEVSDEHYTVTLPEGRTNAGDYTIEIHAKEGSTAYFGGTQATFTISRKAVTITAGSDSRTYDGTALNKNTFTATPLESGDTHTFTVEMTSESTITDVGTQPNVIAKVDGVAVETGEETIVGNYLVTTVNGTLTINPITENVTVTITEHSNSDKIVYDGKEHTVTGYDVTSISNTLYTEADFTFSGNAEVKGTNAGTYEMELKPEDFTNTNQNFSNVTFNVIDGALTITPVIVKVSVVDKADGKPIVGNQVVVQNSKGVIIHDWCSTSTEENHEISVLKAGGEYTIIGNAYLGYTCSAEYTLTIGENGNVSSYSGTITQDGVLLVENSKTHVNFSVVDKVTRAALGGARVQVKDSKGTTVDEWDSGTENNEINHIIEGLTIYEEYTLCETVAPNGYAAPAACTFTIDETGKVTTIDGTTTTDEEGNTVLLLENRRKLTHMGITVAGIADHAWTGSAITPDVVVKDGETDITDLCDITYSDNTDAGQATITITAKDGSDYAGSTTVHFLIYKTANTYYVDADGTRHDNIPAIVLSGYENSLNEGTYLVESDINVDHQIDLDGNVTIILGDGAKMNISDNPIYGGSSAMLTIYGQTQHGGEMIFSCNNSNIYCLEVGGGITINSGTVYVRTEYPDCQGIHTNGDLTINGGTIDISVTDAAIYAGGTVRINGGQVTAISTGNGNSSYGIYSANSDIILGYANASDFVNASSYRTDINKGYFARIKDGLMMRNHSDIYDKYNSMAAYNNGICQFNGIKLEPVPCTVTFDIEVEGNAPESQTVLYGFYATEPTAPTREGYDFAGWKNGEDDYDFATPVAGDLTLTANWEIIHFEQDDITYEWTNNQNVKVTGYNGTLSSLVIPASVEHNGVSYNVTEIGQEAFMDNSNLRTINLAVSSSRIEIIGARAFKNCTNLSVIDLPGCVTAIEDEAFSGCALTEITLPASVTNIGENVFEGCNENLIIYVPEEMVESYSNLWPDANILAVGTIPYIAADGSTAYRKYGEYTVLTGSNTTYVELGSNGKTTWYVVNSDVEYINKQINLVGDVNLILCDGKTMTSNGGSASAIMGGNSLTIYGQTAGTGTLKTFCGEGSAICSNAITINGGTVNAIGGDTTDDHGIFASGNVTINGGTVNAEGGDYFDISAGGNVIINGGKVSATGNSGGIMARGNIILGWTNNTDRIYASSFSAGGTISIADGKAFTDGANVYTSATPSATLEALTDVTLIPKKDISTCSATVPNQTLTYTYNGNGMNNNSIIYKFENANNSVEVATQVDAVVMDGSTTLTLGTDYEFGRVTLANGDEIPYTGSKVGDKCKVEINGIGDYAGTTTAEFKIIVPDASDDNWGDLTWAYHDGTLTISKKSNVTINVAMPDGNSYADFPWHNISSGIFTVTIGEGIIKVGNNAFAGTSNGYHYDNLATINLPSTLTTIGENAFAFCPGLTIDLSDIPDNITSTDIGLNAFSHVGKLTATLTALESGSSVERLSSVFAGYPVEVSFSRSFTANVASTLCLPYDFEPKGGTCYEFTSVNDAWTEVTMTSVNATSTTPLTAGKPYLFMPAADGPLDFTGIITNVANSYTAGTTTPDGSPWTFTGTYEEKRWDATHNTEEIGRIFGFATNQGYEGQGPSQNTKAGDFIRLNSGGIKPFRAYLKYTGTLQARTRGEGGLPETMTVRLVNANGEIQGIGEIRLDTGEVTFDSNAWFDLNGRRLDGKPSEKGIYINGGRKVVIK